MHEEIIELFDLTGNISLVVGGARHLGFDMAKTLAGAGSDIVLTSTDLGRANQAAEAISSKYNVAALPLQLDHTEFEDVSHAVDSALQWKGRIDVLINNAGGGSGKGACRLFERTPNDLSRLIEVNLTGALYCCREVGKIMADQGRGKIINIASIAGLLGRDRRMYDRNDMGGQPIDYSAAKAGVIGMTRDLAAYLSPMGITVNSISPGGFNRDLPQGFVKEYSDRTPLGRMGRDGIDLNGATLFLASAASDYVTGHNLVVDGGFSIWQ